MPQATKYDRKPLTITRVKDAEPGFHWDAKVPSLGLRVRDSGRGRRRSFVVRLPNPTGGKPRLIKLGDAGDFKTIDDVRKLAQDRLTSARSGEDAKATGATVADLFAVYMKRHAEPNKAASSVKKDRDNYRLHIADRLGKRVATSVTRRDVAKLRGAIADAGSPGAAERVLSLLRTIYNVAAEEGELADDYVLPFVRRRRGKAGQGRRVMRFLTDAEFTRLLQTLRERGDDKAQCLELLALTGLRLNEAVKLEWDRVDLRKRVLRFEPEHHKAGNQSDEAKEIPIGKPAADLLKRRGKQGEGRVFPNLTDNMLEHAWGMVKRAASLDDAPLRIHDLRHSYASMAVRRGVNLPTLQKMLGHKSIASTMVYAKSDAKTAAAGAETVAEAINALRTA